MKAPDSCNAENNSFRMINSNMAIRIAELDAWIEERAVAANLLHIRNRDCADSACVIADKYREA